MGQSENFASYIRENKEVLKDYVETRLEIYRLKGIKTLSKTIGFLGWIVISLFLFFLVIIFGGMTLAYFLSDLFNSTIAGFGVTTLFLILVFVLLTVFRRQLFINPVITNIISQSADENKDQ